MFPIYPYIDVNDLNLDYLLKCIKDIQTQVEYFVSLNAIKYANPIQWDITRQYEKNTIVIDPLTGTAYISVAPVPAGTALTRPEYWTVVFDLQRFVTKACKNFTTRYEAETTTTATFNTPKDGWLCWADVLYKANVNITAGDSYVPGGNITAFTMEDFGGHLEDLLTTDKSNVVAAINELVNVLIQMSVDMGDLNDLTTVDKTSIVNAINELVLEISNAINIIGDLNDLTTIDKTSIVNAINEVMTYITNLINGLNTLNTNVGNLANLATSDKSSIVNAINELAATPDLVITPEMFGAVKDGITDDSQAIQDAFNYAISVEMPLYFSEGVYAIASPLDFSDTAYYTIIGVPYKSYIKATAAMSYMLCTNGLNTSPFYGHRTIFGLTFDGNNVATKGIKADLTRYSEFNNCQFVRCTGIGLDSGQWCNRVINCAFDSCGLALNIVSATSAINNYVIDGCIFTNNDAGMKCGSSHDLHITNSCFDVCRDYAICLYGASDNTIIHDNYFEACGNGSGLLILDENNNNITMRGTILTYGEKSSPYYYYHSNLQIHDNFFANCYSNICCMSHIANCNFENNGFLGTYNALVELVWHGSNIQFSQGSRFIAYNSRESTINGTMIDNTTNSSMDCKNIICRVYKKISDNRIIPDDHLIDLLAISDINGDITESGTATPFGHYNGNVVYELSGGFDKSYTIDLTKTDLIGKTVTIDGIFVNKSGFSNGLWFYVYVDGTELFNQSASTSDGNYRATTYGRSFTVPTGSTMTIRVKTTYNTSELYATRVYLNY